MLVVKLLIPVSVNVRQGLSLVASVLLINAYDESAIVGKVKSFERDLLLAFLG